MGQHRQQPLIGGKHHAAHMKKYLIWSLGIVVPFLVLFCIFPSGTSLYKPSYNRIVVSQLQVPVPRVQSGFKSKLSSHDDDHQHGKKPPSKTSDGDDDDDSDGGIDDDVSDLTLKNVKKQSVDATTTSKKGFAVGDSLPKATKKQKNNPKEMEVPSVVDSSTSKAKERNQAAAKTESWSADADTSLSPPKAKKQGDGNVEGMQVDDNEEKKQTDGHDEKKQITDGHKEKKQGDENEGNHLSPKAKGDEDDQFSSLKAKKHEDIEEPGEVSSSRGVNDGVDLSSKKARKQIDSEPEINAFMTEKEVEDKKKKKAEQKGELDAERSETEKSTKKEKKEQKTEVIMPEVELQDEELSLSGKDEADQHIEIKKSTKKAEKAMPETDDISEPVEDSIPKRRKADQYNDDISTAKSSRGVLADEEEDNISLLGEESSLDEDPTSFEFSTSKQSTRKTMGMSYFEDPAANLELEGAEEEVSFSGKKSMKQVKEEEEEENGDEDGFIEMGKEEEVSILGKKSKKQVKEEEDDENGFTKMGEGEEVLGKNSKKQAKEDDDGFTKLGKKADFDESFTKLGKVAKGKRTSDLLFLKKADEEAQSTNANNKKKSKPSDESAFEEMEDADNTSTKKQSNLPGEDSSSSKKSKLKKVSKHIDDDGEREESPSEGEGFSSSKTRKSKKVTEDVDEDAEREERPTKGEDFSSSKKSKSKKYTEVIDDDDVEREEQPTKFEQKREKDVESSKSSTYEDSKSYLEKADDEAFPSRSTTTNKKKKQFSGPKLGKDLDDDLEQPSDEANDGHMDQSGKGMSFTSKKPALSDLEEVEGVQTEASPLVNKKGFKKKIKDVDVDSTIDEKGGEDVNSFKNFPDNSTGSSKKKKQTNSLKKISNEDSNDEVEQSSLDDDASIRDPLDHTSSVSSKASPLKTSMQSGKCRYFKGRWTMDSNYPPYKDSTCPWKSIDDEQSCKASRKMSNWRWKPAECNMQRFKANAFLKLMQGKSMAFVGDMMVKAQIKSLVCLLAKVETPRLLYNDKENQSMSWNFVSSNLTLSLIWSPYLIQQTNEYRFPVLRLDKLDTKWAEMVPTLDVLVLGVGTHFAQPTLYMVRDDVVGCYSCKDLSAHLDITKLKEISLYSGFRATMRSSIMGIGALPGFEGTVLFLQPFGFEGNGSYYNVSLKMKEIQDEELKKAYDRGSVPNLSKMEVLHTNLNSMAKYDPINGLKSPTCLIPSPVADTWNQILQHTLAQFRVSLESDT